MPYVNVPNDLSKIKTKIISTISLSDLQNIARYGAENTIYQQKLSAPIGGQLDYGFFCIRYEFIF